MPGPLWSPAIELAREFGVSRTARTLWLVHNTLKQKSLCSEHQGQPKPPSFISYEKEGLTKIGPLR